MLELAGVTIPVTAMHDSTTFYTQLLGRPPAVDDPAYTLFECPGGQIGLLAVADPGARAGPQPLLRTEDLDREWARIRSFARKIDDIEEQQGYRLFLFADPDGNTLEVYEA